jgi:hypothetical protein
MGKIGGTELLIILTLAIGLLTFIPKIFYLLTIQNTFKKISLENRKMQPSLVWLSLIPIFGLIWQFIIVNNLADSLKAEFIRNNIENKENRPGIAVGLTFCILNCISIIPFIGILTSIIGIIFWIIYWVKISGFKTKLDQTSITS